LAWEENAEKSCFHFDSIFVCHHSRRWGINFINILRANFSYERLFGSFSLVKCKWKKYKKFALKMLMKLTRGVNFTNILQAAFLFKTVFEAVMCLQIWFWIFFLERKLSKKLLVKCWWNWLHWFNLHIKSRFYTCRFQKCKLFT